MSEETPLPWERQMGETAKAWEAFCVYRDLGVGRSMEKVRRQLGKSTAWIRVTERWSVGWAWQVRVTAWDAHLEEEKRRVYEETILREAEQDAQMAMAFIGKAAQGLNVLVGEELSPETLLRFWTQAVQIRRQARGLPGQIHEVRITDKERRALALLSELVLAESEGRGIDPGDDTGEE